MPGPRSRAGPGVGGRNPRPFNVRSFRNMVTDDRSSQDVFTISGVSRDNSGVLMTSCSVLLFDQNNVLVARAISDATTGAFTITVPDNGKYNAFALKYGSPSVAGGVVDVSATANSAQPPPPTTIATILGADTQLWYANRTTGSGATLTWVDEEAHVNVTTLGTAPTVVSVGTGANTGMRFSGAEELTNGVTLLSGPSAGNPVNRVIYGFAIKVTGSTPLGGEGAIFTAVASGVGSACLKAVIPDTGKLEFLFRANNASFAIFDSNASLVDSTWHTGIAIWNGTTGLAQMYVDGILQTATDSTTGSPQRLTDSSEQIYIGETSSDSFKGDLVSPFLGWNATGTSYTAGQIAQLHSYLLSLVS